MVRTPSTIAAICALALAVMTASCGPAPLAQQPPAAQPPGAPVTSGQIPATSSALPPDSLPSIRPPLLAIPSPLRGLYVNHWAAIGPRMRALIELAKRTEINTLVIDVKDDRGFVLYPSRVALAHQIGADATNDTVRAMSRSRTRAMLDTLRANDIYAIARIVVAKDPLLAERKLEWSIKRKSDGQPWLDAAGHPWLDAHQDGVWNYAGDLAEEAIDLGFDEVQFDYVRFPDDNRLAREAVFPLANGRLRAEVIREQLGRLHHRIAALGVRTTIDVFGLTTSDTTDMGIGQRWESFVDQADVVLPMVYPSHYAAGTYGVKAPNANPYAMIDHALKDARRRSAGIANAAEVIPWYQAFTLGPPRYGAAEIRAQMQAGYDNGVQSWILWNPGSSYIEAALQAKTGLPDAQ